jgi:hypothetical protein
MNHISKDKLVAHIFLGEHNQKNMGLIDYKHQKLDRIMMKIIKTFKKIGSFERKIYIYEDLQLEITNYEKTVYCIKNIDHKFYDQDICVVINHINKEELTSFPLISQYHDVIIQKVDTYISQNQDYEIHLINEEKINILEIEIKKQDKVFLWNIITQLIQE